MSTLINEPGGVVTGAIAPGTANRHSVPTDKPSARRIVIEALQSSSGIARLTTQTGNASEVGALLVITGDAVTIGSAYVIANAALGSALTAASTFGDLVTAVAAS